MKTLLITLLLTLLSLTFAQQLEIHVIDVGQGDSILIQSPSGQNVLVDGGPYDDAPLQYLRSIGVEKLDLVIASHPHADHIAGLEAVVRYYEPDFYMDNGMSYTTQTYQGLLEAVADAGSQLLEPTARRIKLGEVTLQILPSAQDESFDTNNNSVGLIVDYGEFEMSLAGDAEGPAWNYWAQNYPDLLTDVDVHKSSHHGSRNGDTPLTMELLQPEVVIISAGPGNDYGHPHPEALRLYAAIDAKVYRTDLQGTIIVKASADGQYEIVTEREGSSPANQAPVPQAAPTSTQPQSASGSVTIVCVLYDPDGRDEGNEQVTLRANEAVDITGWVLKDEAGHSFTLSGALKAGKRYRVPFSTDAVWNNGGDAAFLYDAAGQLVDSLNYSGGDSQACR